MDQKRIKNFPIDQKSLFAVIITKKENTFKFAIFGWSGQSGLGFLFVVPAFFTSLVSKMKYFVKLSLIIYRKEQLTALKSGQTSVSHIIILNG